MAPLFLAAAIGCLVAAGKPARSALGAVSPHWLSDGASFWISEGPDDRRTITKVDPHRATRAALFDVARLRADLAKLLGHEPPGQGVPFADFELTPGDTAARFRLEQDTFTVDLTSGVVARSTDALVTLSVAEKVRDGDLFGAPLVLESPSPDGRWFAGVRDANVSVRPAVGGERMAFTTDGVKRHCWDVNGTLWSADSRFFCAEIVDSRAVPTMPLVHWLSPHMDVDLIPFAKAGDPLPTSELFVFDVNHRTRARIELGEHATPYVYPLAWRPDSPELWLLAVTRNCKRIELIAASPQGAVRVVLTEASPTFFDPGAAIWSSFRFLAGGGEFLWASERDGFKHLYRYRADGTLVCQLTTGTLPIVRLIAVDERCGALYVSAHSDLAQPYDTHVHRVSLAGGPMLRLTEASGQHDLPPYEAAMLTSAVGPQFCPSLEFFLDTHASLDRAPSTELRKCDGTLVMRLTEPRMQPLTLGGYRVPETFVAQAADDATDLHGVLFKPTNFTSDRRYPVIESIYAGPQTTWVPRIAGDFRAIQAQGLAELGAIVVIVDARGTTERGKEFQDVVYRNFGRNEIPDHVAVLEQLARERPYMDLSRVGVVGASFGGYFAIRAMLLAPEIYRVGVAVAPIVDMDAYALAVEGYMDLPDANRDGYAYADNTKLVDRLAGELLLIHGTSDVNAHFGSTVKLLGSLARANKPYDLIVLPEADHGFAKGNEGAYMWSAVARYFKTHLLASAN